MEGDRPTRRVYNLTAQLGQSNIADRAESSSASNTYATATGAPSSYATIHGAVSRTMPTWTPIPTLYGKPLTEVLYHKTEHIAKITINRPSKRNAFTPTTVMQMSACFTDCRDDTNIRCVILTGAGDLAFCSGGDQAVRGHGGYQDDAGAPPRLNVLDLQIQIRRLPVPVIAAVAGYAVGGGHILHMVCDMTIAAENAVFGQTGPKVGSFDAGYGSTIMSRLVGPKRAREIWFMCRLYSAGQAMEMGLVNKVVPVEELQLVAVVWAREVARNSPTAIRFIKAAMNAADDGHAGLVDFGGAATGMFYKSEEGCEGRDAFKDKRTPDFQQFPRLP